MWLGGSNPFRLSMRDWGARERDVVPVLCPLAPYADVGTSDIFGNRAIPNAKAWSHYDYFPSRPSSSASSSYFLHFFFLVISISFFVVRSEILGGILVSSVFSCALCFFEKKVRGLNSRVLKKRECVCPHLPQSCLIHDG